MLMNPAKRILISRTEGEWRYIMKAVKATGSTNIDSFLRKEITKLGKRFEECPDCVSPAEGEKQKRCYRISDEAHSFLSAASKVMNKPISTIVDELIINPILTGRK